MMIVMTMIIMYSQSIGYDPKPMHQKYINKLSHDILTTFQDDEYVTDDDEHHHDDTNLVGLDHTTTETTSNNPSYMQSQQDNSNNMMSSLLDKDGLLIQGRQKGVNIIKELKEICIDHDASNGSHNADHLMIELNGYKFSQNATFSDVVIAAIHAIFQRMENNCTTTDTTDMNPVKLLSLYTNELSSWGQVVLQKLCYSLEEEKHIIYTLEQIAISSLSNSINDAEINDNDVDDNDSNSSTKKVLWKEPTFRLLLQKMHDLDILSEECVLEWASERKTQQEQNSFSMDDDGCVKRDTAVDATIDRNKMLYELFNQQTTQDFLSWLEEESESDDDDDGSSSDGDDSEED